MPEKILSGTFTLKGELAVNTDAGLKYFGHLRGASGLRIIYEVYLKLEGKADQQQV
jgi:acetyl-CoA C-acetyltransferase